MKEPVLKLFKRKIVKTPALKSFVIAAAILFIATFVMFYDILLGEHDIILSNANQDLSNEFLSAMKFGFQEIAKGNLPLWCPHIYSGLPFFGAFQSALLYPLNIIYLFLPLPMAINYSIILHIFLSGLFMYLWAYKRNLHFFACLLASFLFMFSGTVFIQVYSGHLPHLCTMVWAPLLFLSVDGLSEKPSLKWCLSGMFAVAMQIFGGHPQYFFYTFVAVVIYSALLNLRTKKRLLTALCIFSVYTGGMLLSSVQLLTGMEASGGGLRNNGLSYEAITRFSFPPENLLLLISPSFLGNMIDLNYWGKWNFWETYIFIGITGFILAIYGVSYGKKEPAKLFVSMIFILFLFALGSYTPLFKVLYILVPGFNKFRAPTRFLFQISLFIIMLSSTGMDSLFRNGSVKRKTVILFLIPGIIILILAGVIVYSTGEGGLWMKIMDFINPGLKDFLEPSFYIDFVNKAAVVASRGLFFSGGIIILIALLLFLTGYSRKAVYIIFIIAVIEIFCFARIYRPAFEIPAEKISLLENIKSHYPGDYRFVNMGNTQNLALYTGMYELWGYDPCVVKRYAEFIAFTQGYDVENPEFFWNISQLHPLFSMLRCRFVISQNNGKTEVAEMENPMSRLHLIQDYRVITERDKIFAAMEEPSFNPRKTVILEEIPVPEPVKSGRPGYIRIIESSSDYFIIEAELPQPEILLITDTYIKGWQVLPLRKNLQKEYRLIPANYTLQAIPLSEGSHLLLIDYSPLSFRAGKWISIISLLIYILLLVSYIRKACFPGKKIPADN